MADMILSIKSKYATDILSGKKRYELRKVKINFDGQPYVTAHLYATPSIGIIGRCRIYADYLEVEDNYCPVPLRLVRITQAELEKYLRGEKRDPAPFPSSIVIFWGCFK